MVRGDDGRVGVRVTIADHGSGIAILRKAFEDGYSTGDGPGLGLGGARRLVSKLTVKHNGYGGTTV